MELLPNHLSIDGDILPVYGIAKFPNLPDEFASLFDHFPGRYYDIFNHPINPGLDEYLWDPQRTMESITHKLIEKDYSALSSDSLCLGFCDIFWKAKEENKLLQMKKQRIALFEGYDLGHKVLLWTIADVEYVNVGFPAGRVSSVILKGYLASLRTGRTSIDKQPYWEMCTIDPEK